MKTIVVTAYAISPYKGSEDGTAWNLSIQLARFYNVIVITRKNNKEDIEKFFRENTIANIQFDYFDLPYILRFWKKKSKGALLYFYLWQIGIALFIKRKYPQKDLYHNLNFHNDWTPSFLWILGKPWIWGPIGHHPKIKSQFTGKNISLWLKENLKWWTKKIFWNLDPFHRISRSSANLILAINSQIAPNANLTQRKTEIFEAVGCTGTQTPSDKSVKNSPFTILSVGRMVSLKGFDLTLDAFNEFCRNKNLDNVKLILVGKGPLEKIIQQKIIQYDLSEKVEIKHSIPFNQMAKCYEEADVFLFPSHEGAGMVVPEALSYGIPVICLDNEGPGELTNDKCAFRIKSKSYAECVNQLVDALNDLYFNPELQKQMSRQALLLAETRFTWNAKGEQLHKLIEHYVA